MSVSDGIGDRLLEVREEIAALEARYGRPPGSVALLAVSKTKPAAAVRSAHDAGQDAFGENHLQDALTKIEPLAALDLEWHFIGAVQSNKTRPIAAHFDWVQSVDRLKIARRLSEQRPADRPPMNVCIEVNSSGESSKSGIAPDSAAAFADELGSLPNLRLRGLMSVPAPCEGLEQQRRPFAAMRKLFDELNRGGLEMDTLSMGMSGDLEAAIAEGATMVRIGTAIFGAREK